jgi:hypothetical protein
MSPSGKIGLPRRYFNKSVILDFEFHHEMCSSASKNVFREVDLGNIKTFPWMLNTAPTSEKPQLQQVYKNPIRKTFQHVFTIFFNKVQKSLLICILEYRTCARKHWRVYFKGAIDVLRSYKS